MNKPVIEMNDVSIVFGDKTVLKNISLSVKEHESIVFIGPSGSGKTVLLKTLAGIIAPTKGEVLIYGEDWQKLKRNERHDLAGKLGVLFQYGALFDTSTAKENVEFPLREHTDFSEEEITKLSLKLLSQVNLEEAKDKIPSQLSGGMQRRLGIARALALNPDIIFYDDPVAGQDPMQSDQMLNLMKSYKRDNNSTLIMITSSIRAAYKMADRIYMVIDQEIIDAGSPEEIKNSSDPRIQQFINGHIHGPITAL